MSSGNIFLQLFGAGGVIAILTAIVAFLTYLSNHRKNRQDGYSKVFQDQDKNMATIEKRYEDTKLENKDIKKENRRLERQFDSLIIFVKNLISSLEDDEKITTPEAYQYRIKVQEIEFSE